MREMSRAIFRITNAERVFPRAKQNNEIRFKSCLRCKTGDLVWDILLREWGCLCCGWLEFELTTRDPETQRSV